MRILFICTDDPAHTAYGSGQRNNLILRALQELGVVDTIWTAPTSSPYRKTELINNLGKLHFSEGRELAGTLRNIAFARKEIARLDSEIGYDLIVARYISTARLVPARLRSKLIFDCDDFRRIVPGAAVHTRIFLALREGASRRIAKQAAHTWVVSEAERAAMNLSPNRVSVLFNTVMPFTPAQRRPTETKRILMVAGYGYPPNHDGLVWFAQRILKPIAERFPDVQLHAVGAYHDPDLERISPYLQMRGFVDDLAAEYARADVVICPIRSGSGSQIKLVEGVLSERPTVSSEFSYIPFKDVLRPKEHLLVARTDEEWISAICEILNLPETAERMAKNGRKHLLSSHSPKAFVELVATSVSKILEAAK